MKCVRCGSEMKDGDRCCLKCGAINYHNKLNNSFIEKYADRGEVRRAIPEAPKKKIPYISLLVLLMIIGTLILIIVIL